MIYQSAKAIEENKSAYREKLKRDIKSYIDMMRRKEELESHMLAMCMLRFHDEFHTLSRTQNIFNYSLVVAYMMYWITLEEKYLEVNS